MIIIIIIIIILVFDVCVLQAVVEDLPLLNPVGEYTLLDFNAAELADATKKAERAVREKELGNQA